MLPFVGFTRRFLSHRCLNHRAIFDTRAASRAQVKIDAAGAFANFDLEIAWLACNGFQVCVGD
jgi:hypothetical protein